MKRSRSWIALPLSASVLCASLSAQATSRLSLDSGGVQGDDGSSRPSVSADGRFVAFQSPATNLVPADTNVRNDIFVRDRQSGATRRVSIATGGAQGNGHSYDPSISADGTLVAFWSLSDDLVAGDTNAKGDVFVHDRQTGVTERVSVGPAAIQAIGDSQDPCISADGRYVAFRSFAGNLVVGDTNGKFDVFVHDRLTATTERVSVDTGEAEANDDSVTPAISADGRYVTFASAASNLVPGDVNGLVDVFVRDRQLGVTELVSVSTGGLQGDDQSLEPSISADGRYVAFHGSSNFLVTGDSNLFSDVFVRDRQNGTTSRVSVSTGGAEGDDASQGCSISGDGRYVAFESLATNLVGGDANGTLDVFVHDRQGGTTERASLGTSGAEGDSSSTFASISLDGRFVSFHGSAANLVDGDTNGTNDVFLRDRLGSSGAPMVQSCFPGTDGVIACPCGQPANPAGGCANFGAGSTSGAVLNASGTASVSGDTVLLTTSNHRSPPGGVLNVFFSYKPGSATPTSGAASGAGVRCYGTGGSLKRLYTVQVFGGSISKPGMGDLGVSAQSATFPGHAIVPPESRHYFNVYRDGQAAGPCLNPLVTTNVTNMGIIVWIP